MYVVFLISIKGFSILHLHCSVILMKNNEYFFSSGANGFLIFVKQLTHSPKKTKTNKHLMTDNSPVRKTMTNRVEPACQSNMISVMDS